MIATLFCPLCGELVLDRPTCSACGWRRPPAGGAEGAQLWRTEIGRRLSKPRCYPAIAAGCYCVPTEDGAVIALDLATGRQRWERALGPELTAHALATDGRRVFVGCADTRPIPTPGKAFLALDARTGELAWEYPTDGHSLSAAAVSGTAVYFTSSDGLLHAVDTVGGRRIWARAHDSWGPEAPAIDARVICAGGRGERLVGYALDGGAELWRFGAEGWFAAELGAVDGQVYALCWDGWLYALDALSGRLAWKVRSERNGGFTSPPLAARGRAYVGGRVYRTGDGGQPAAAYALLALQASDGAELWRFYTGRHVVAAPASTSDTLLFGSDDGCFYAIDAAFGAERWRARIDGRFVAQPLVFGDCVYLAERDGVVAALRWRPDVNEDLLEPDVYTSRGEHESAAIAHALRGQLEAAALIYYQQLGRSREAALLYERAGKPERAAPLWQELGDLRRARDCYDMAGDRAGHAAALVQLGEPPAPPQPKALDQEEIDQQRALLATYRDRLAYHLEQSAILGSGAPYSLIRDIREAREQIRQIKDLLRGSGVGVDDGPNDMAPNSSAEPNAPAGAAGALVGIPDRRALREALIQAFNLEELSILCADIEQDLAANGIALSVNLDLVGGDGKPGRVFNLMAYLERRGYLGYLASAVRRSRPGII